jgi:hypothetical protein
MQPALLYIVPGVIGFVAVHCLWNGEVKPVSLLTLTMVFPNLSIVLKLESTLRNLFC